MKYSSILFTVLTRAGVVVFAVLLSGTGCGRLTSPPVPAGIPAHAKQDKVTKQWVVTSIDGHQIRYYSNGRVAKKGRLKNRTQNGTWTEYAQNGVMTARGAYTDGKKTGRWEYRDQSGRLYLEQEYAATPINEPLFKLDPAYGTENGRYRRFFPNGRVEEQGYFKAGKYHGLLTRYYVDGRIAARGRFEADAKVGKWVYYYPEGGLEREEFYVKGALQGPYRNFHPDGSLKQELRFQGGKEVPGSRKIYRKRAGS